MPKRSQIEQALLLRSGDSPKLLDLVAPDGSNIAVLIRCIIPYADDDNRFSFGLELTTAGVPQPAKGDS